MTNQLRDAIRKSGLTHYRLAQLAGTSVSMIDRFVREERDLYLSTASKIAGALGLELANRRKPLFHKEKKT